VSSWKELGELAGGFEETGTRLLGVSADSPEELAQMREKHGIPFTFLSDPQLTCHEQLDVPVSRRHPKARSYPRKAFLQPALFVWRQDGTVAYEWRQTPRITNLFGASSRLPASQVLSIVRDSVKD
jgi:peroxiredoxin